MVFGEDPFPQDLSSTGSEKKKAPPPMSVFRSTPWSMPIAKELGQGGAAPPSVAAPLPLLPAVPASLTTALLPKSAPPKSTAAIPAWPVEEPGIAKQLAVPGKSLAESQDSTAPKAATKAAEPSKPKEEIIDPGLQEIRNKMQSSLAALSESLFGPDGAKIAGILSPAKTSKEPAEPMLVGGAIGKPAADSAAAEQPTAHKVTPKEGALFQTNIPAGLMKAASKDCAPSAAVDSADGEGQPEMVRASALATLAYYGLKDPSNQEELTKAVASMSAATGDQAGAAQLYQQAMAGLDQAPPDAPADAASEFSMEQQLELQRAAATAQYSQFWMHQQFQAQMEMFENQRLLASGASPTEEAMSTTLNRSVGLGKPARTGSQPMLPGDWTCKACGDHQFARNRTCRFCGAGKPAEGRGS
mmetsp:Transcript_35276/g.80769  ORF Transcript_35276/g.80769 Transcript_35276/m.80769 type:complete len:415 (-) Transcript_35276:201-1445(-)